MFGQDHRAAQLFAHRAVIGRGRGAKADDRHRQPRRQRQNAAVLGNAGDGQGMASHSLRSVGADLILGKGGLQQAIGCLLGQLVDDLQGKRIGASSKPLASAGAAFGEKRHSL